MSKAFSPNGGYVGVPLTADTSTRIALPALDQFDGVLTFANSSGVALKFGDENVSISDVDDGLFLSWLPSVIRPTPGATHVAFFKPGSGSSSFKVIPGRGDC